MGIISGGGLPENDGGGVRGWVRWMVRSVFYPAGAGNPTGRRTQMITYGVAAVAVIVLLVFRYG